VQTNWHKLLPAPRVDFLHAGPGQQQQQQHRQAAALAATEPLRAAVQQFALRREAVQLLQAQLDALRGQTRAARLLTKQGCCVSIQQVAAADGRAVEEWLSKLLGRAERCGPTTAHHVSTLVVWNGCYEKAASARLFMCFSVDSAIVVSQQ
jgi:hypothetical protein